MEDIEKITIKITNHLTGEISEVTVSNLEEAKNNYIELSASEGAIKKVKKRLASWMDEKLGDRENHQFADGKILRRVQRESKQWTVEGLKEAGLDEDAIAAAVKVDMTMAKQIVKELMERGEVKANAAKILNDSAIIKATAPFVEIR